MKNNYEIINQNTSSCTQLGTPCIICNETVTLNGFENMGAKVCDKCKSAIMKIRKNIEKEQEENIKMVESTKCPKCGGQLVVDTSVILCSNPPQYYWRCDQCDHVETKFVRGEN